MRESERTSTWAANKSLLHTCHPHTFPSPKRGAKRGSAPRHSAGPDDEDGDEDVGSIDDKLEEEVEGEGDSRKMGGKSSKGGHSLEAALSAAGVRSKKPKASGSQADGSEMDDDAMSSNLTDYKVWEVFIFMCERLNPGSHSKLLFLEDNGPLSMPIYSSRKSITRFLPHLLL